MTIANSAAVKNKNEIKLLYKAIEGLDEKKAKKLKISAEWNAKDVIAHLIGWKMECVKRIKLISLKKRDKDSFNYNVQKFNSAQAKKMKGKTLRKLIADLKAAEQKFQNAVQNAPREEFAKGWGWNEEIGHDRHHAMQIIKARKKANV